MAAKIKAPHPKALSGGEILADTVFNREKRIVTVWRAADEDWQFIDPRSWPGPEEVRTVPRDSYLIIEEGEGMKTTWIVHEHDLIRYALTGFEASRGRS